MINALREEKGGFVDIFVIKYELRKKYRICFQYPQTISKAKMQRLIEKVLEPYKRYKLEPTEIAFEVSFYTASVHLSF